MSTAACNGLPKGVGFYRGVRSETGAISLKLVVYSECRLRREERERARRESSHVSPDNNAYTGSTVRVRA